VSRSPRLALRRTRQTLTAFDNGPRVLWELAAHRLPWGGDEVVFRAGSDLVVHCPNRPGARVPVYEIFAEDAYRLSSLLEGLTAPVVLDIGAHIGCFALAVAAAAPAAQVHSYEASPATATWLARNVAANGLADRISTHQVAIAGRRGALSFADNDGGSSLNGLTAPTGSTHQVEVPCITFADAVTDAGGHVDLVKIDTEGAEYDFVLSSDAAAWASVRRLVLEYHDVPGHDWFELRDFFAGAGLRVTDLEAATPRQGTAWLAREH
jgi:FkbM family methyltransferase